MKKKLLSLLIAVFMVIGIAPVVFAEGDVQDEAYLMYADGSWTYQYWNDGSESDIVATKATITGVGEYTVGLDFTKTADKSAAGLSFSAIGITTGETTFPGYCIELKSIKVNGEDIAFAKGYTSSDDGIVTRMNILNEWVAELPEDARSFDGNTTDSSPVIVDKAKFESVETIEVTFALHESMPIEAYLMYADSSWTYQYWNDGTESDIQSTKATVTGAGEYTVGLDFSKTADKAAAGLAFAAVGIGNGETAYDGYCITIQSMKVNGKEVDFSKGYTSSDDGIITRMNIYNEWVTELPEDARSSDGVIEGAGWIIVDKALFDSVTSVEVTFRYAAPSFGKDTAFIMYADSAWAYQYWGEPVDTGIKVTEAEVEGEGNYTVALDFSKTADGKAADVAFTALGILTGETTHPGYVIRLKSIKVNGEAVAFTKGYTSSDDGIVTRTNIYNEWVTELPPDARTLGGNLDGANWIIVDKAAFTDVVTYEINFDYIYVPVVVEEEVVIDIEAALAADYNAYFGTQTTSYIFRNAWNDNYGIESENWTRLTGWDADSNEVDYGGTFTDTKIEGNGSYSVAVELGEMGFGTDEAFRMLFVSTDIPSKLIDDGLVTISNVKTSFDGGKALDFTYVDTKGDYAQIAVINEYNNDVGTESIAYGSMPKQEIVITFDIAGLSKDAQAEATPTSVPTVAPTEAPVTEPEKSGGLSTGALIGIIAGGVVLVGGGTAGTLLYLKKKGSKTTK